jgi:hypothetical protein
VGQDVAVLGDVDVVVSIAAGDRVLVEAVERRGDEVIATMLGSVATDTGGQAAMWGRIDPPVPTPFDVAEALAARGAPPDAEAVFADFRSALGEGPRAAASCFAEVGVFSHASFVPGGPRVLAHGPYEIELALQARRPGPPALELVVVAQVGRWALISGWGNSPQGRRAFLSSFTMDRTGRLLRYLSVGVRTIS